MASRTFFVVLAASATIYLLWSSSKKDASLNVAQLIKKFGYPLEIHQVTTEDGYILTLHRIPNKNKIPVLLMHGIMQSAAEFVNLGPGKAISLLLADQGFDVWLGNVRGTTWSRKHKNLDPNKDNEFWNFSIHEIGYYDVPAKIDYILKSTGHEKLHYLGYSQGTLVFFILTSERPEYNAKVRLMSAMAPVIYLTSPKSPVLRILPYFPNAVENTLHLLGTQELFAQGSFTSVYLKTICDENSIFIDLCLHTLFLLQGYSEDQLDKALLSRTMWNLPAGISTKQFVHFIQLIQGEQYFQNFDYGPEKNLQVYGQESPILYNVSKVVTPVALYYSCNDYIVSYENALRTVEMLPNVVKNYSVPLETFNHYDFLHGKDVNELLYKAVIEEIMKH